MPKLIRQSYCLMKGTKLIDFIDSISYKVNFEQDKVKGLPSLLQQLCVYSIKIRKLQLETQRRNHTLERRTHLRRSPILIRLC